METQRKVRTIKITSLEEYLQKVKELCVNHKDDFLLHESLDDVWFRGESQINKTVVPSLFRNSTIDRGSYWTFFDEHCLIEKALQYYPKLFKHCDNAIERLITMQHYTLPTRLLDVTKSPLVALFFACFGNWNKPGRVLFLKKLYPTSEEFANKLAIVAENIMDSTYLKFQSIIEDLQKTGNDNFSATELFINSTKNYLYIPKYDNDRIKHQQGAVIISSLFQPIKRDKEKYKDLCENISNVCIDDLFEVAFQKDKEPLDFEFEPVFFKIPSECKQEILIDLDNCGINEAFVYPEPEHQMQYVKWHCTRYNESNCDNNVDI